MLSSDVSAGYDPAYGRVLSKRKMQHILAVVSYLNKFTGARGKSGSNDANAEYVAKVRKVFDDQQCCIPDSRSLVKLMSVAVERSLISLHFTVWNVIDSGVAVLSMHAPWEVTSKADIYEARKSI